MSVKYYSIQQLMKMDCLPYRSRYGIQKLIREGYLKAVVKRGKGIGTRYFIPETAISECNRLFFAESLKNTKNQ
uniref:Uncharacterized protein n=1 Tax=Caldisericum exile TaxID=693075 RepID=A0A7C4Y4G6_9BACT